MQRIINYEICQADAGKTISEYLRARFYTAKILTIFRHSNEAILLNGTPVFLNNRVKSGDIVTVIYGEEDESENVVAKELPFGVVYEDEDIMVVEKPADMPVHPSLNNFENTLANGIAAYFEKKGQKLKFRCINRLDRDTSGLLIVAKHRLAAGVLSDFMVKREIKREYRAWVLGTFEEKTGKIDLPIGRENDSLIKRVVDFDKGEEARTNYAVLVEKDGASLLSIRLETGRTHQIRVHMSHIGHPLLGDSLYGNAEGSLECQDGCCDEKGALHLQYGTKAVQLECQDGCCDEKGSPECEVLENYKKVISGFKRQALHSYMLEFRHPITLEPMKFVSEMPDDIML